MNANTQVTVTSPVTGLKLRSLRMRDALSQPFEISVELLSEDFDLDFAKLLGAPMGICLTRPDAAKRWFHGLVAHVELAGGTERFAVYRATLRPWLWFLSQAVTSRIFQDKTALAIVKTDVFKKRGFDAVDDQTTQTCAKRDYCVQYAESDFAFASRLLEEEGVAYYFRHEKDKHVLVLCDSAKAYRPAPHGDTIEYRPQSTPDADSLQGIAEWHEQRDIVPGAFALADYDFTKPRSKPNGKSSAPAKQEHADFEQFEFPGGVKESSDASTRARLRREALQGRQRRFSGRGNPFGLGATFKLSKHRRKSLNQEYLVVAAVHELASNEYEHGAFSAAPSFTLGSTFEASTSAQPFRPARLTARPVMRGPQTARVTGPSGSEIHTDKYGRIKVKFPWDRDGADDDKSSCWLRVSQGAAGKGTGLYLLPRVDEEVIVDFLHGDPDQPIVTGRLANADHMPPYDLPANKTRSVLRTRATPKGGDANVNELRFEDKSGEEEIYLHAERDFHRIVKNNDALEVGGSGCKDGSQTIKVWKNRSTTIQTGDDKLTLSKGDRTVKIDAGSHTLEAKVSITFKVGSNSITIDQSGVTIKALQVKVEGKTAVRVEGLQVAVQAKTALDLGALMTNVDSKALLGMKGALVKIN